MNKPRVIKDYEKLSEEVKQRVKLVYPRGFSHRLISFVNKDGEKKMGLPFETEDHIYLIRMTAVKAIEIVEADEDFDDDGILKDKVVANYSERYDDDDALALNANDDNDFELSDEDMDDD